MDKFDSSEMAVFDAILKISVSRYTADSGARNDYSMVRCVFKMLVTVPIHMKTDCFRVTCVFLCHE